MKWLKMAKEMAVPPVTYSGEELKIDWGAVEPDIVMKSAELSTDVVKIEDLAHATISADKIDVGAVLKEGKFPVLGLDSSIEKQIEKWWNKHHGAIMGDIAAALPIYAAKNQDDKIKSAAKLLKEVGIYFKNLKANYENDAFVTVDAEMCFNDASTVTKFMDALHGNL